ncbi:MAG TPA: sigma-70 family RNA polymerase sigma factor [Chthonomonadaceae bacterium]|nr:sigma-70 family RNA polymerase sigma factor [Chthonomonadaceae bacterium]
MQTHYDSTCSDEELVIGVLLGNPRAFDALVLRFRSAVLMVARQVLGDREAAEDVAQEAFVLAFRALPQLEDPGRFAGWLYAIARNRAQRVALKERRSEPTESEQMDRLLNAQSPVLVANPVEACLQQDERALLLTTLQQLPDDYQTVLHLRYYEEWPVARIADFLSLPTTTVNWRLHYGRRLLRRLLTQKENLPDEQRQFQQRRDIPNLQDAARASRDGRARKHHRVPKAGQAQRDPALQRDPGPPGTDRKSASRSLPPPLG